MHRRVKLSAVAMSAVIILSSLVMFVDSVAQAKVVRVACVGDSITEGSGYTVKLKFLLGNNYIVRNFGVSGSTVSLASEKPYLNQTQFKEAQDFNPEIVIIMLGTNDASQAIQQYGETFEADYGEIIRSFQGLQSKPAIWIVKSPPIQGNSLELSSPYFNNTVIPHIERVADTYDLPIIDVYGAFGNHSEYYFDGVHPNPAGADVIATTIYDSITSEDWYSQGYTADGYYG
ncbi:MAG: GDSL-type esterase/lipase family protein [Candidatus Bathyarchaeota archaeon]|nr:GDSL-type esterase/lipase family protein [Candidatus Bathyarchaeota archaeon]